jgi:hypothetical protein
VGKKFLLAAVVTFLSIALGAAFYSDGSLVGVRPYYLGNVVIYSIFAYPLAAAIVVWEHNSPMVLKCLSASTGLMISLFFISQIGPVAAMSSEINTSFAVVDRLVLVFSCFILSTTLTSVIGRIAIILWNLFRNLTLKLKNLSRALPNQWSDVRQ